MGHNDNAAFTAACEKAGIPPTAAQFSKFRRHFGLAYTTVKGYVTGSTLHQTTGLEFSDQRAGGTVLPQEYGPYSKTPSEWPKPKKQGDDAKRRFAIAAAAALILLARAAPRGPKTEETP